MFFASLRFLTSCAFSIKLCMLPRSLAFLACVLAAPAPAPFRHARSSRFFCVAINPKTQYPVFLLWFCVSFRSPRHGCAYPSSRGAKMRTQEALNFLTRSEELLTKRQLSLQVTYSVTTIWFLWLWLLLFRLSDACMANLREECGKSNHRALPFVADTGAHTPTRTHHHCNIIDPLSKKSIVTCNGFVSSSGR